MLLLQPLRINFSTIWNIQIYH